MNPWNWILAVALHAAVPAALAQAALQPPSPAAWNNLAPLTDATRVGLHPAWQLSGLPGGKIPVTRFVVVTEQGNPVLRISTDQSYGVLTHHWQGGAPTELAWRWKLVRPLANADIQTKAGDDAALKVCIMFDQPLQDIPFVQRSVLALARARTNQQLPSATVCYLWDSRYPPSTSGHNPYTARVRYIVLNGANAPMDVWVEQRRRIADDFHALFGQESQQLPPVIAVAVGADSDNTKGSSQAYLSNLRWIP